jgi:hypothetical protein
MELNGLPLAIEQAGALLRRNVFSFSDFIPAYRAHFRRLMDSYPRGLLPYDKDRSFITVFDMLYDSLNQRNPEAAVLLLFAGVLGPWQIPISLMTQFQCDTSKVYDPTNERTKSLKAVLGDNAVFRMTLDLLTSVCLLKIKESRAQPGDTFLTHRVVCHWCVESIAKEDRSWILLVADVLASSTLHPTKRCTNLPLATMTH